MTVITSVLLAELPLANELSEDGLYFYQDDEDLIHAAFVDNEKIRSTVNVSSLLMNCDQGADFMALFVDCEWPEEGHAKVELPLDLVMLILSACADSVTEQIEESKASEEKEKTEPSHEQPQATELNTHSESAHAEPQGEQEPKAEESSTQTYEWSKSSSVAKPHNNLLMMVAFAIVVLLVLGTTLLFGHSSHIARETTYSNSGDVQSSILADNEKRLEALRNQQHPPPPLQPLTPTPKVDNKAMTARRNAPTQMFAAKKNSEGHGQTHSSSEAMLTGQDEFSKFANQQSKSAPSVTATTLTHPHFTVAQGELIAATLETAINSDLPGMVRAVITRPVYAYVGRDPLIPAGSRLVGQYASLSSNGAATTRVFVIWNRIITPQGISIMINSPGSDSLGRVGMSANSVDAHFFKIFGTASLLSVIGAGTSTIGVGNYDQPNSADLYRASVASAFQDSARASLAKNLRIKPTLHIHQGNRLTVFVARDLDVYAVLHKPNPTPEMSYK